ncbi:hypothetical protein BN59_00116 [Legionella massiliensis]|uniref:Uncharacterized protein n=1 Tax=Legionella massiliensis TaxID=1034943 RepID=A0A078KSB0_9GAMM|nr:hypothetical protein [Legionella massiliensis]CDZ75857.1 hypothetical protein BN59_00116 [Legionella massiliensis]CEE11595.1 hypothetical protein BN1094_00116 [Legionella massiliensis]
MAYHLNDVEDYAGRIADITSTNFTTPNHWKNQQEMVERFAAALKKKNSEANLANYAAALRNAASYLIWRRDTESVQVAPERQSFIDGHLEALKKAYRQNYPQGDIKAPSPILDPSDLQPQARRGFLGATKAALKDRRLHEQRKAGLGHAPELNAFIASAEYNALQVYLKTTLTEDSRSHSYFCGLIDLSEKRKATVLHQFLVDITSLKDMDEVKNFLTEFYSEKHKAISTDNRKTWGSSRFDILNTGQNMTTRFFSILGKQTTTINLIDSLAASIGFDPLLTEEVNQGNTYS